MSPKMGWQDIAHENTPKDYLQSKTLVPMLALVALSSFFPIFSAEEHTLTELIKYMICDTASVFIGYVISVYLLAVLNPEPAKDPQKYNLLHVYSTYVYVLLEVIVVISNVLDVFLGIGLIYLLPLLLVLIINAGTDAFDIDQEGKKDKFALEVMCCTILPFYGIRYIFNLF